MKFGEKLQALRKEKGLTQEELSESLYVSRTAVSKWESGRGYPSIDSIKDIAAFFSVTIDELLSSEKILSIAGKEKKATVGKLCNLLFGIVDLFTLMLVILPLYPSTVNGDIYSVCLFEYTEISPIIRASFWILYIALTAVGLLKIVLTEVNVHKGQKIIALCSLTLGIAAVILLSISRQAYATVLIFALLVTKGMLYLKQNKA